MTNSIHYAAELLGDAKSVVALTGAGISKESGIPTFRDAQTGLWANFNPQELATPSAFRRDPGLVWRWYDFRRKAVEDVEPNAGHYALVEIEKRFPKFALVTQNVDGLHARAGSKNVICLHGDIRRIKCFDSDHPAENVAFGLEFPPKCHCGSLLRPAVVWFEEALPEVELAQAFASADTCELMLVVGTSGLVQPAAALPLIAKRAGAKIIEVNPEETPLTAIADLYIAGPSGEILPKIVKRMNDLP